MKICFITPSLEKGGMERVLVELANYGVQQGYEVFILSILPDREIAYSLDDRAHYISSNFQYRSGILFKTQSFLFLKNKIEELKPNVCLSFSETFNPLAILAARSTRTSIYISDRSNPLKEVNVFKKLIKKTLYPLANGMIAQTIFAKNVFERRKLNKNIVSIPNPLREIRNLADNFKSEKNIIISVGRLVPSKNFGQLLEIFSKTRNTGWELWILGEGREREKLEQIIEDLQLNNNVKLLGEVDDVDTYLQQAAIFAFTSLSEGFPNALSEGMATPLACIAFDCAAGPADIIIDGESGYLVPLGEEKEYIEKLQLLMENSGLRERFKKKAYKNRVRFSQNKTSREYFNFILDI